MKKLKILAVLFTLVTLTNVHAALQSRPGVKGASGTAGSYFFKLIREMEADGGALGLNATFAENTTTGEYQETSDLNNVDSHMCKNTEWGAAAMLSASPYGAGNGNVKNDYDSSTLTYGVAASTTGNMTGIFGMNSGASVAEFMSAGIISKMSSGTYKYLINAPVRYVDNYADSSDYKDFSRYIPGDATYETKGFKDAGGSFAYSREPGFKRTHPFRVYHSYEYVDGMYTIAGSRLVVWVGEGL